MTLSPEQPQTGGLTRCRPAIIAVMLMTLPTSFAQTEPLSQGDIQSLLARIREIALSVPGVLGVEKLFVRKSGLEHFVDIHVEVAPEISVREGHEIGHAVKDRLVREVITVRDVLVHIEPYVE